MHSTEPHFETGKYPIFDRRNSMTVKKRTERLMKENIPQLIEKYFDIVLNERELTKGYTDSENDKIIKAFELIASKLPVYTPNLRAKNTGDILRLLRRGKVTIQEAKELMLIMATDFEVTEIPKMMERMEELTNTK